jgi:excisionase family DNA binding protein
MQLLLKPKEAAQALSISVRTLWTLTQTGQIAALRAGRIIRYRPADLQKWVDANVATLTAGQ